MTLRSMRMLAAVTMALALTFVGCTTSDDSGPQDWELGQTSSGDPADAEGDAEPPEECRNPEFEEGCDSDLDEEECEERGGRYGRQGLSRQESCLCPTRDGGCECSGASDCDGACLAEGSEDCEDVETGTCAEFVRTFGCACRLQDSGRNQRVCVD